MVFYRRHCYINRHDLPLVQLPILSLYCRLIELFDVVQQPPKLANQYITLLDTVIVRENIINAIFAKQVSSKHIAYMVSKRIYWFILQYDNCINFI
jgi:hypothetical protein